MIRLEHLNKYFNKGRQNEIHVINDVSLELPERGMVAIFGKSGCGKTTLLNVIGGLDRFSGGSVTVDGQSIRQDPDALRNREMGYIFQNYNLCKTESCYDNVADALRLCGMRDGWQMRERVTAALRNVGMENFASRTPDTLSGGQQQRVAIARAIVKDPRVILADEPTGNLDEANTLLVMELLREIAQEHLVLLVTHEEDLVDHYCETVVELCDGKVVNVRHNEAVNGLRTRDKNDVFLGELEKHTEAANDRVQVEYYGDTPAVPVRLRVVNDGGRFYLSVDTPNVRVLDAGSEVKLREGVFEAHAEKLRDGDRIDMSALPPMQGTRYGRLYTFRSAVRSGWRANFGRRRRGKKFLLGLMTLFSMVLVLMTSLFSTSIRTVLEAREQNSRNTFYLYTPSDGSVSDALAAAVGDPASGIDGTRLTVWNGTPGDKSVRFRVGFFETANDRNTRIGSHAVYLHRGTAEGLPLLAGRATDLGDGELLISSALADALLEDSTAGYLKTYADLIGLRAYGMNFSTWDEPTVSVTPRIAGVVERDEAVIWLGDELMAALSMRELNDLSLASAAQVGYTGELPKGSVVLYVAEGLIATNGKDLPQVGDELMLHGLSLTVREIVRFDRAEDEVGFYGELMPIVCREDYYAIAARCGETDPIVRSGGSDWFGEKTEDGIAEGAAFEVAVDTDLSYKVPCYTAIHSTDPDLTERWLREHFGDLQTGSKYREALYTPELLYERLIEQSTEEIVSNLISMAVIVVILCVCVYFIMRSSLMKSIREVGIYRAIGVTRKNLVYRFFVESLVLTALTTLLGFLLSSAVMRLWLSATPLMGEIFYYPLWLAACLLCLIVGVCLLCGVLPAVSLLRKTPSEILAKYDI